MDTFDELIHAVRLQNHPIAMMAALTVALLALEVCIGAAIIIFLRMPGVVTYG
jgi:hypothetical protein